ncbi:hypothetical protein [Bradyrhizobium sp. Leo121]|uniref:hypothetical protein n=1 Tax=Bradyrhizobium sp. Leo121 TaxID=1571195 RepID=UPI001028EABC|nr:hypothetical protein [Bradyrhizobium sp. Leo121]RZN35605.1 hypothetical protein CWO90_03730 [Bradyrhizobium sp. Leo121]
MTKRIDRIPNRTLDTWEAELANWMQPPEYRHRLDEILRSIPRSIFFRQAGLTFLRDAWIASRVADALSSDAVRLVSADRPDFEVQTKGQIDQFEATEADMDGRRRGDEPNGSAIRQDPVEDWRKRFEAIPAALDRVISKKLSKEYRPDTNQVIYINLGCYGAYVDEGLPILRKGTFPAKDAFRHLFVLWEGTLYRFWEDGAYAFDKWQSARVTDF